MYALFVETQTVGIRQVTWFEPTDELGKARDAAIKASYDYPQIRILGYKV